MPSFTTRPLDPSTWPAFAALVERHNGVWSGCWCMSFHAEGISKARSPEQRRCDKETRVREGRAHASLVYDGETCIGWCQFGPTDELPRIKHRKQYESELKALPDWRITCFFTDKAYRGQGVADVALKGAVQEIGRLGGGVIESYPEDVAGRKTSSAFLHNGTRAMFERHGFKSVRRLGMHHWVVAKTVVTETGATKTGATKTGATKTGTTPRAKAKAAARPSRRPDPKRGKAPSRSARPSRA